MNKKVKGEKITFRVRAAEKRRLCKKAEQEGLSVSEYIRKIVVSHEGKKGEKDVRSGILLVKTSEILNYIQEKYDVDRKLERMVDELWESMKN